MTIEEMNALSEEELEEAQHNWTLDDWITYYTKDGVMTLDEAMNYLKETTYKLMREKYGSDFK